MVLVATSNRQPDALYLDGTHEIASCHLLIRYGWQFVQKIDDGMDWRQRALDGISMAYLR